jgi:hypothetical protein
MDHELRDVHEFDGKIDMNDFPRVKVDDEDALVSYMREIPMNPMATSMAMDILRPGNDARNTDGINKAHARALLLSVLSLIHRLPPSDRGEWHGLLEEQLRDMSRLGPCPQGRTIRLWQLLQCLV